MCIWLEERLLGDEEFKATVKLFVIKLPSGFLLDSNVMTVIPV
jgi:hypothetical protein